MCFFVLICCYLITLSIRFSAKVIIFRQIFKICINIYENIVKSALKINNLFVCNIKITRLMRPMGLFVRLLVKLYEVVERIVPIEAIGNVHDTPVDETTRWGIELCAAAHHAVVA